MTFIVHFQAEQAFLSFVKKTIETTPKKKVDFVESGAMCVIGCTAALESFLNALLRRDGRFRHSDELKISSKIDTLGDFGNINVDWGAMPWQIVARMIRVRNWLVHFKDSDIGLINSDGEWIVDELNKHPKFDPDFDLSRQSIREFYDSTRAALKLLAEGLNLDHEIYEFLDSEQFNSYLVG